MSTVQQTLDQKILAAGVRYRAALIGVGALVVSLAYAFLLARDSSVLLLWAAPIALVVTLFILRKPEYGAVVLLGLSWGYLSEIASKYHGLPSINKALVPLLLFALVIRRFIGERRSLVYDQAIWWMIAYWLVIALGLWYAPFADPTMTVVIEHFKDVLMFVAIINLLCSIKHFELTMWVLLAIGAVLGSLTVYQEIARAYSNDFGGLAQIKMAFIADGLGNRPRASGSTGEPIAYGQQLLVLVPIGIWGAVHARSLWARTAALYATLACVAGIVLSFSRGSYIALAVVLVLFALYIHLNPRYLAMVAVLLVLVAYTAPPEFKARFGTLENLVPGQTNGSISQGINSEGSFRGRFSEMMMAVYMFADHPVLGVGASNFRELYPEYIREYGSPVKDEERNTHNYYLEVAAEHGLLGLIVFGGILVITLNRLRLAQRLFSAASNTRLSELAVALQLGFIGYLVSAMFFHGSYPRYLWLQVALAVAFGIAAQRYAAQHQQEQAKVLRD